jgi:Ca-activated chloride channel family protein
MRPSRRIVATIATLLALVVNASFVAQTTPSNPSGPQTPSVRLNVIVTDSANHSLDDIRKGDIRVFEDKVEQTVLLSEKDERPVDYGIVIDTSGSFKSVMGPALEAVSVIISNNRPADETFIERFVSSDKIETLRDFTSDKSLLLAALKSIRVEGGQSAVLDALYLAVDHTAKHAQKERRQAVVLITDGEDRQSFYKLEDTVKFLRATNVQVFIIGIVFMLDKESGLIRQSPRDKAEKLLATFAEESGGRLFFVKNLNELAKAVAEIVHDLRGQFLISYQPTNSGKTSFRKVDVKLVEAPDRKKWSVIARPGYYLNAPGPNAKP